MTPKRAKRRRRITPICKALVEQSPIQQRVMDGLGALTREHHEYLDEAVRPGIADSLDTDEAMSGAHAQDNRWDYLLGHRSSEAVVGLEPHSARDGEVSTVIAKRMSAIRQLRPHFRGGVQVERWLWVASGLVNFADTEKARRRLDENGIQFVGKKVLTKHMPSSD